MQNPKTYQDLNNHRSVKRETKTLMMHATTCDRWPVTSILKHVAIITAVQRAGLEYLFVRCRKKYGGPNSMPFAN